MAFQRRQINQTSTFETGTEVTPVTSPTFQLWQNTTGDSSTWNLGQEWSSVATKENLTFKKGVSSVLTLTAQGATNLTFVNQTTEPATPIAGMMAQINGELKIYL
tara:strand:- start:1171 stop:1485 length:315 start_codon:yes stop_codon:yes gene_type:complete